MKRLQKLIALPLVVLLLFSGGYLPAFAEDAEIDANRESIAETALEPETAAEWEAILSSVSLGGNWAVDLVVVAESQVAYSEVRFDASDRIDGSDGTAWTRYGAWYGDPYGEWDMMFVAFCLHYAGIDRDAFPYDMDAQSWLDVLRFRGMYQEAGSYTPKGGDLVFFDLDGDRRADHVGIVRGFDPGTGNLLTIEGGRSAEVERFLYPASYDRYIGFGILPDNPSPRPSSSPQVSSQASGRSSGYQGVSGDWDATAKNFVVVQSLADHIGGITIYIEAGSGALPDNSAMTVSPVNGNSLKRTLADSADAEILEVQALHILFHNASDGHEVELSKPVRVIMYPQSWNYTADRVQVWQICDDGSINLLKSFNDITISASGLRFEADRTATYAIAYTKSR